LNISGYQLQRSNSQLLKCSFLPVIFKEKSEKGLLIIFYLKQKKHIYNKFDSKILSMVYINYLTHRQAAA
jgi:hypothetical protein